MSWFSELTSRAEAMLVKLDQDAAVALQNPDSLLSSKLLDRAKNTLSVDRNGNSTPLQAVTSDTSNSEAVNADITTPSVVTYHNEEGSASSLTMTRSEQPDHKSIESEPTREETQRLATIKEVRQVDEVPVATIDDANQKQERVNQRTRQFRLQTNSIRRSSASKRKPMSVEQRHQKTLVETDVEDSSEKPVRLDADNIRASINRTLQEYSEYLPSPLGQTNQTQSDSNNSFFDQQPNLVSKTTTSGSQLDGSDYNSVADFPNRSNSFSIDVPDDRSSIRTSDAITVHLLRQGSLRKKSTQYIHKVINRLANQNSNSRDSIFNDYMKIKLRRVQLRAASYARRLNYYFRAYPQMKYVMVGYLIVMQLLAVYVLFFYQSSSTKVEMTSQLNKQAGLAEPQQP